jgi:hypothetical protein
LKQGPNQWITDRVDGLITDATNSPFTTIILPYMYMDYPDRKIEWNVWTFDQGLASRVPYEAAARTLTQRKQSFSGYTVRQGLAITMEHNFMMSDEGMTNFHNQVTQVVGSIQNTNDLDVHMALINAPSYLSQVRERYYLEDYLTKSIRDYIDMFGFVQKNMNSLDIIIEDTRSLIKNWGGDDPDFMLCSGKLTYQLTMTQERTSYYTQGVEGQKLLKQGPDLPMYRGLKIIKSKAFSLDEGSAPRDVMRRRVRVAEFYLVKSNELASVHLYDEMADNFAVLNADTIRKKIKGYNRLNPHLSAQHEAILLIRPNIEHYMLGVIIGRGGIDHLGATLWGQTEMSVFDDGQHGVWGMTYKYHERAIVFNERNLHRVWDVAYDGYVGGKDMTIVDMNSADSKRLFINASNNYNVEYEGASIIAVGIDVPLTWLPSPMLLCDFSNQNAAVRALATADMFISDVSRFIEKTLGRVDGLEARTELETKIAEIYNELELNNNHQMVKDATLACTNNESTSCRLMYSGTSTAHYSDHSQPVHVPGSGHHGNDYPGVAAVRNGKQLAASAAPAITTYTVAPTAPAQPPVRPTPQSRANGIASG